MDFKQLPNLNPNVKPLLNLYKQAKKDFDASKILTLLKKAKPKPVVAKVVKGKPVVAKVVKPKIVLNMKRKPKDESRKRK